MPRRAGASWHPICGPVKRNSTLLRHQLSRVWLGASPTMGLNMPQNLLRQPNFAALVVLAWLLLALVLLLHYWEQTAQTLLDTDDAMRLTQMRAWLAGHGWYDLHEARLQPPQGHDTHWSRLIDVGLAGLTLVFRLGVDTEFGRALDARFVATALAVADHGRHGGDRLADRRPGGRHGGAAAGARRRAGLSAIHPGPHRSPQRHDCADAARRGGNCVVRPQALDRRGRGCVERTGPSDRARMPAVSRGVRRRAGGALCAQPRRRAGGARLRAGAGRSARARLRGRCRIHSMAGEPLRHARHQFACGRRQRWPGFGVGWISQS